MSLSMSGASSKLVPFEQMPNLPSPIIPKIDLGIKRVELEDLLQIRPSVKSTFRKIGHSIADHGTQTDQSDILDLKYTIEMLRTLTLDTGQLRKDLTYAQSVLNANYEKQISDRSTELYCRINERLIDLEKQYKKKMDRVRKSYQSQLENSIQVIAGEYKAYYNNLLKGKKGRHDKILQDLQDQLVNKELLTRQQEVKITELESKIKDLQGLVDSRDTPPTPPPVGLTVAEAEKLQNQVTSLKENNDALSTSLAIKEDENSRMSGEIESLTKQLSDQKSKYKQLEKDMETHQKKAKKDQETAARLAENQLATMQKELKAQMEQVEKEAADRVQQQAELQRMKDQAKFHQEMERQKNMEEQLRAEAANAAAMKQRPAGDHELLAQIDVLMENDKRQTEIIAKLRKEMERMNKVWEIKMSVMQKKFHGLKDEFFVRNTFKRQAATLQHSTIGFARGDLINSLAPNEKETKETKQAKLVCQVPSLNFIRKSNFDDTKSSSSSSGAGTRRGIKSPQSLIMEESILTIPPPSPSSATQGLSPRVHFGEEQAALSPPKLPSKLSSKFNKDQQ